jgi:acetoin utilization deacetylase AcuC-like enzyme
MGFCLFNNIAIAARYAQKKMQAKRILILDWDVHHGNGTQAAFYKDPSVLFISMHQYPFWPPDSGWLNEDGAGEGKGFNINIPLPAGTGDRGYMQAWDRIIVPVANQYAPDLVLVSAGYDAHMEDPLAQQRLTTVGFTRLAQRLMVLCETNNAKVVSFLEGGYNVSSLAESAIATMQVMNADNVSGEVQVQKRESSLEESQDESPNRVSERIEEIAKHQAKYWQSLRK